MFDVFHGCLQLRNKKGRVIFSKDYFNNSTKEIEEYFFNNFHSSCSGGLIVFYGNCKYFTELEINEEMPTYYFWVTFGELLTENAFVFERVPKWYSQKHNI